MLRISRGDSVASPRKQGARFTTTIGIVGSGIAGLHLALHLQQQGIGVTGYSDRTAEEVRASRLPNSVALMGATRGRDTALGTNHWTSPEQGTWGMMLRVFGDPPLAFNAELSSPYLFIDMRVYLPRLMVDFQERGGKIVFGPVGVDDVTALSANHDLMVVAVGRAGLGGLFPRVAERSPYEVPQRRVVGACSAASATRARSGWDSTSSLDTVRSSRINSSPSTATPPV